MKLECLLCGGEIFSKNKNQLFCKKCRKEFHKDYLTVFKNIRLENLYTIEDADKIKKQIEENKKKQEIEDDLGIPKNKLNWIVKYYYPNYKIKYKFGKKTNDNIKQIKRITKQNVIDEIKWLNEYGVCGTDIALINRISYSKLQYMGFKLNGRDEDLYPFRYKNIYDEWFYFTYDKNRKIFLIATDEETLIEKIKEKGYELGRLLK